MNLEPDTFTNKSRIIILKFEQDLVGVVVDEVKEVVNLKETDVEKVTHSSKDEKNSFIHGVGKYDDQLISLFDTYAIIAEKAVD
jgi:purine-binding chemotaxis protein CheW